MAPSAAEGEPQSLRALFDEAEAQREALELSPDATSPAYRSKVDAALALYGRVLDTAAAVGLFSPNETIDDVATSALPYLLVDYRVAELVQRVPCHDDAPRDGRHGDPHDEERRRRRHRLAVVDRARSAYARFLDLVDHYELADDSPYKRMLERFRDDPAAFALVSADADAAARREAKIMAFRAEKALRMKLEILRSYPQYRDMDGDGDGDDETVRGVHVAHVAHAIHVTFDALDSLNREAALLEQAAREPPAPSTSSTLSSRAAGLGRPDERSDDAAADPTLRLDAPLRQAAGARGGPLLSQGGKPLQPFTLVGSRAELARGVFRPGHNLPTMSIDEYLAEERRRGGILEGGTDPARPAVDEDDEAAADRETYKAREWDDFKDENPRGSGNTLNMG